MLHHTASCTSFLSDCGHGPQVVIILWINHVMSCTWFYVGRITNGDTGTGTFYSWDVVLEWPDGIMPPNSFLPLNGEWPTNILSVVNDAKEPGRFRMVCCERSELGGSFVCLTRRETIWLVGAGRVRKDAHFGPLTQAGCGRL